ncbi:hypothetical protein FOXYSP1_04914 [Fusarium oxysporum f. sp. phaseoli]
MSVVKLTRRVPTTAIKLLHDSKHIDIYYCFSFLCHIRPKLVENTGSRPLSHSQAAKRWISSWVGDDQRIPGVVCFLLILLFLWKMWI